MVAPRYVGQVPARWLGEHAAVVREDEQS
jgi:hypothetical protein